MERRCLTFHRRIGDNKWQETMLIEAAEEAKEEAAEEEAQEACRALGPATCRALPPQAAA